MVGQWRRDRSDAGVNKGTAGSVEKSRFNRVVNFIFLIAARPPNRALRHKAERITCQRSTCQQKELWPLDQPFL